MSSPRDLARAQALGRILLGATLAVAPRATTTAWLGPRDARRTGTAVLATAMGARDFGIGLGTARALDAGFGAKPWIAAGIVADAVDMVATWRAKDHLPTLGAMGVVAMAGTSAALGLYLRSALD